MSHYKPYSSYKDSGTEWLGKLPSHWDARPLKWIGTYQNSNVDKKSYEGQTEVRLCNYTDVYYNELIADSLGFMVATASDSEIESMTLRKGDIVITKDSEDPTDIGIPAIVAEDLENVVCGYHLTVIRVPEQYQRFVHRVIQADATKARFYVESPGITRYGLNQGAIGGLPVVLPPPDEAGRLADFIDSETTRIDALVEKKTRFIELLREKRQALITHAVAKGLAPNVPMQDSGVESLGEVPQHWGLKKLRHIARIVRGASPRPAGDPRYFSNHDEQGGNTPWVTVAEITKDADMHLCETAGYLTPDGVLASQKFLSGTLVFSNSGATLGVPKILAIDCCANDGVLAFRGLSSLVRIEFLYYFLLTTTDRLRDEMQKGAQPNLNTDIVKSMAFPLPPLSEQGEIVNFIVAQCSRIESLVQTTERSTELLKERRSALITAAVTGQIDLRDATVVAASRIDRRKTA